MLEAAVKGLLAVLAIAIGSSIILWVLYNEFVERQAEYQRPPLVGPLGIGPVMVGTGLYWGRQSVRLFKSQTRK